MNIRDLQYLVALADHGHFGKAADASFVSQPALSIQIKKLEEVLGIKLVERTSKSVHLTDNGTLIAERARQILNQVDELREIAKSAQDPLSGEVRIGIFPTIAPYLLPHIMPSLSKTFPRIFFHLVEDKTEVLIDKLKKGTLHAAILALPLSEPGFNSQPLFEEEFVLAVPHSHQFAKFKSVKAADLAEKSLLLLDEGHCMRDQALDYCHKSRIVESQNFRATSLETLRHMVASGAGITLMPRLSTETCNAATYITFESPKPTRTIGLVTRTSSSKNILFHALQEHIKNIMAKKKLVKIIAA